MVSRRLEHRLRRLMTTVEAASTRVQPAQRRARTTLHLRQVATLPLSRANDGGAGNSQTVTIALSVTFGVVALLTIMALLFWAMSKNRGPIGGRRGSGGRSTYRQCCPSCSWESPGRRNFRSPILRLTLLKKEHIAGPTALTCRTTCSCPGRIV